MQYLKELREGTRIVVSEEQHMVDKFDEHYHCILSASGLVIYKLAAPKAPPKERRLKYGGRNRGGFGLPWNGA